jgi:hypothetical protein
MSYRTLALCLCLTQLSIFNGLFAAENPYARIAGTYEGEVFNGADMDPVTTTFTLQPSGRLVGSYTVDEEEGAFSGTLSNILFEGERIISLEWTDQFGEGLALMEFSSDFSSFAGEWTDKDGQNPLPWTGKKIASD